MEIKINRVQWVKMLPAMASNIGILVQVPGASDQAPANALGKTAALGPMPPTE